jgi:glycerol-3-phosphate dehydrogenase
VNRRATATAKLSREHVVDVSASVLVTIAGGKWTTYRKMAEDVVDVAAARAGLPRRTSPTATLPLHGAPRAPRDDDTQDNSTQQDDAALQDDALRGYGGDTAAVVALGAHDAALRTRLHPRLPYTRAQVVYAARSEMARTVDDVLSRRTRALFLDAAAARASAPDVAALLAHELGRGETWQAEQLRAFGTLAGHATAHPPSEGRSVAVP